MHLEKIHLVNFRNYKDFLIDFSEAVNIFVGDNAQGKTNLLEAIYAISTSKSHRISTDNDLIMWGQKEAVVTGEVISGYTNHRVRIKYNVNTPKEVEIDSKKVRKSSQLSDIFHAVVFSPEDLQVIKGSPGLRRRFIDTELVQIDRGYRHNYREYGKALQQRNQVLKNRNKTERSAEAVEIWDEQVGEYGSRVIESRIRALADLNDISAKIYSSIAGDKEKLSVEYSPSFQIDKRKGVYDEIKPVFLDVLKDTFKESVIRGYTLAGPHRDDIAISINGQDIRLYGSQGQQRTAILAMKMAMLDYVSSHIDELPVLLLDDVMSELDEKRRKFLLSVVSDRIQTFITTTSPDIGEAFSDKSTRYMISAGQVARC